jgi:hypothetical protein
MANATLRYQTKKITNSPPKIIQQHPENPQILEILIWLTPRYAIRQIKIPNSPPKIIGSISSLLEQMN